MALGEKVEVAHPDSVLEFAVALVRYFEFMDRDLLLVFLREYGSNLQAGFWAFEGTPAPFNQLSSDIKQVQAAFDYAIANITTVLALAINLEFEAPLIVSLAPSYEAGYLAAQQGMSGSLKYDNTYALPEGIIEMAMQMYCEMFSGFRSRTKVFEVLTSDVVTSLIRSALQNPNMPIKSELVPNGSIDPRVYTATYYYLLEHFHEVAGMVEAEMIQQISEDGLQVGGIIPES